RRGGAHRVPRERHGVPRGDGRPRPVRAAVPRLRRPGPADRPRRERDELLRPVPDRRPGAGGPGALAAPARRLAADARGARGAPGFPAESAAAGRAPPPFAGAPTVRGARESPCRGDRPREPAARAGRAGKPGSVPLAPVECADRPRPAWAVEVPCFVVRADLTLGRAGREHRRRRKLVTGARTICHTMSPWRRPAPYRDEFICPAMW